MTAVASVRPSWVSRPALASAWRRRVWCPCSLESPSRAGASARPAVVNTHCSVAPTWEGLSPGVHWDLAKSRPDRFWRILAIRVAQGVLRVPVRSQIARTRADFERFSEVSETLQTEVWSEQDLNFQPRFSSARRQPIVAFNVAE